MFVMYFESLENLKKVLKEEFFVIDEIGEKMVDVVIIYFYKEEMFDFLNEFQELGVNIYYKGLKKVKVEESDFYFVGKIIVLIGKLEELLRNDVKV